MFSIIAVIFLHNVQMTHSDGDFGPAFQRREGSDSMHPIDEHLKDMLNKMY